MDHVKLLSPKKKRLRELVIEVSNFYNLHILTYDFLFDGKPTTTQNIFVNFLHKKTNNL